MPDGGLPTHAEIHIQYYDPILTFLPGSKPLNDKQYCAQTMILMPGTHTHRTDYLATRTLPILEQSGGRPESKQRCLKTEAVAGSRPIGKIQPVALHADLATSTTTLCERDGT